MTMLQVKDLHKFFEGRELLKGVSFSLSKGEIICLLGPSGSGKSTLLRIIAGLEFADSGQVTWDGMDISQTPTHLRNFGMMFQDYALFSHLTVGENIAFGLRMQKMTAELIQQRVENVAGLTQLQGFINRGVTDLSGGEQQRVALARALAPNPRLMMLDEPLGALDRKLKEQLLDDLRAILKSSRLPTIYVTHDQAEAYAIADRILLLDDGVIVQDATPQQIYREPANAWVARFMGLGNVVQATIIECGLQLPFGTLPGKIEGAVGQKRDILLRPDITIGNEKNGLQAKVLDVQFTGEKYRIEIEGSLVFRCDQSVKPGDMINITKIDWIILK